MTESFLRKEIEHYIKSGYKVVSHVFSNAKTTFQLSNWAISQVVFDKTKGEDICPDAIKASRYELEKGKFVFKREYTYNYSRPSLLEEIDKKIKENKQGLVLGNLSYMEDVINLTNKESKNGNIITTDNIKWCLLSKGLCFNTHHHYFERNSLVYKGRVEDINDIFSSFVLISSSSCLMMLFFSHYSIKEPLFQIMDKRTT